MRLLPHNVKGKESLANAHREGVNALLARVRAARDEGRVSPVTCQTPSYVGERNACARAWHPGGGR